MIETLKLMDSMIYHNLDLSYDEISEGYRQSRDPSLLALCFRNTFNLTLKISKSYFGLNEADLASIALEELDRALQLYDKSKGMVFTSYYSSNLQFRLRYETQQLTTHKRKAMFYQDDIDDKLDVKADDQELDFLLTDYLESAGFNPKELEYSKLLLQEYSNKEIAEYFDTQVMALCRMRKKMKEKISSQVRYGLA